MLQISASELRNATRWCLDRITKMNAATHAKKSKETLENPSLPPFLGDFYGCDILEEAGHSYPVTVLRVSDNQVNDPDSVLKKPLSDESHGAPFSEDYVTKLKGFGRTVNNDDTFVMEHVAVDSFGNLEVMCGIGKYFDAINTCDLLELETMECCGATSYTTNEYADLRRKLTLRSEYKKHEPNPLWSGKERSAAIGASVLVVYESEGVYHALLGGRGKKTAVHADAFHVAPASHFQARSSIDREEFSLRVNTLREYSEELFNCKEAERSKEDISPAPLSERPEVVRLEQMLRTGEAKLQITGYCMNLLNLRPEFCLLLLIRDPQWVKDRRLNKNWEIERWQSFEIEANNCSLAKQLSQRASPLVPPGAAAFWLGIERARHLLGCAPSV